MFTTIAGWTLTEHARQRMQQRAIKPWMVEVALERGEATFDRGLLCFTVKDKVLENTPYERLAEQLRGLCVVVNPAEGLIVTVKWCDRLRRRRSRCVPSPRRSVKNFARRQRNEKWAWTAPTITG